jgi:membrane protease YdiL (CAAX protease family)
MSETDAQADSVFVTAITVELGMGFIALLLGWLFSVDVRQWIPPLSPENSWAIISALLWGTLAALPMLAAVELIERIDWAPFRELRSLDQLPVVAALLRLSPAELIAISIAAGVGEELLIRGWLMGWLIGSLETATPIATGIGLIASSLAFGLMHPVTPTYIVLATLIGMYLGGLVIVSGNLLIPIVAHATYDAAHLLLARRGQRASQASAS